MNIKKKMFVILTIVFSSFIMISCGGDKDLGDGYIEGQDAQYMFLQNPHNRYIAKGEEGYYFINGMYLYYADSNNMKPVILCNKPNCLHDKETDAYKKYECNAYVGSELTTNMLTIYDGKIYFDGVNMEDNFNKYIFSLDLDGSNKKAIYKVVDSITSMVIHRGKLYYSTTESNVKPGEDDIGQNLSKLMEMNLSNPSKEAKTLREFENITGGIQGIVPLGNRIYFLEYGFNGEDEEFESNLRIYNIQDETFSEVEVNVEDFSRMGYNGIFEDKIIYNPIVKVGEIEENYPYLYSSDLNGKNSEVFYDEKIDDIFYTDDKYIYLDNLEEDRRLKVIDEKGSLIENINISEINRNFRFIGSDGEKMFIKYEDEEKAYIKYIDVKDVGNGKTKIKDFFEIEQKYMNDEIRYKR